MKRKGDERRPNERHVSMKNWLRHFIPMQEEPVKWVNRAKAEGVLKVCLCHECILAENGGSVINGMVLQTVVVR